MNFSFNQLVTLFIYLIVNVTGEKYITVWEHPNSQGVSEDLCVSHCSNIRHPKNIKLVSSINLQGNCARFYDHFNCSGKSVEVLPNSASHNYMVDWKLDDRSRSVGPCRNKCDIDVTGKYNGEDFKVQLFSKANYLGDDGTLIGTGCLSVPNNFIDQVKSIKTFGQCIELYNNPKCLNFGANMASIELREDTYFHNDFMKWNFPIIKSISHCRFKCNVVPRPLKIEEVTIFDQINFTGSWIKLKIDKCTNLPYQWEMGTKSLELSNGTIVEIYEDRDCNGESFVVKSNNADLLTTREKLPARSIRKYRKPQVSALSSSNTVPYYYVGVSFIVVIMLVIVFFLGKRYGNIKRESALQPRENGIAQYIPGNNMETQVQQDNGYCENLGKNLYTF